MVIVIRLSRTRPRPYDRRHGNDAVAEQFAGGQTHITTGAHQPTYYECPDLLTHGVATGHWTCLASRSRDLQVIFIY